ncbi:16S rRNA (guanine(527)-N(7))-methyltransferase RsmG [Microbacterium alcoholitolerans]|uniref:16S rRNA (guanine(527)-N(7))-methyltransferase RsmG n=1 Tax=unclassified Microbacterium TaxID=2609290 RepID=UPI003D1795E7
MPTTPEAEPTAAASLFGPRIDLARQFTAALIAEGELRGLIGPLELPRIWTRHILNSAIAAPLFHGSVADVGSGAGLPGLVLAISRPDVQWTLIEPMDRRVTWLNEQIESLGLDNVTVMRARGEDVGLEFDVVTARAVSALRTLIPITAPLVKDGGELILLKGQNVDGEIAAAQKVLKKHKVTDAAVEILGEGILSESTRVFRARVRA